MKKIYVTALMATLVMLSSAGKSSKTVRLILLPDTQNYAESWPDIFYSQTRWIADNADGINFVLQQGDLTNRNTPEQWEVVSKAFETLDQAGVPYTFVPGNHDTGPNGNTNVRETDHLNTYLPYERYKDRKGFGGIFEHGHMENSYHTFSSGKYDFLILSLEFAPRDKVLEWAAGIVERHPFHNVIINTHAYMYSDENRMGAVEGQRWLPAHYGIGKKDTGAEYPNNGQEMWDKFVSRYGNIFMVVSGHVLNDGVGTLVSEGLHGNKVYQMLANYQGGVIGSENGGNGFLRIIDIDPVRKTMTVSSYSPYTDTFRTEADQSFAFGNVLLIKR